MCADPLLLRCYSAIATAATAAAAFSSSSSSFGSYSEDAAAAALWAEALRAAVDSSLRLDCCCCCCCHCFRWCRCWRAALNAAETSRGSKRKPSPVPTLHFNLKQSFPAIAHQQQHQQLLQQQPGGGSHALEPNHRRRVSAAAAAAVFGAEAAEFRPQNTNCTFCKSYFYVCVEFCSSKLLQRSRQLVSSGSCSESSNSSRAFVPSREIMQCV